MSQEIINKVLKQNKKIWLNAKQIAEISNSQRAGINKCLSQMRKFKIVNYKEQKISKNNRNKYLYTF